MASVREDIAVWLLARLAEISGVTAIRPKRVHWTQSLAADLTVVLKQSRCQVVHEDATDLVFEQAYEIYVVIRDSDAASASIETRINSTLASIIQKFAADETAGGEAMYSGLSFKGTNPIEDPSGQIGGEVLTITVHFSALKADLSQKGAE